MFKTEKLLKTKSVEYDFIPKATLDAICGCCVGQICIIRCMEQGIVLALNFILMIILHVQRRWKTFSQCVIKCMEP